MRTIARLVVTAWVLLLPAGAPPEEAQTRSREPGAPFPRLEELSAGRTAGGYVLERDGDVAREEPGPHDGGGRTLAHSFFRDTPKLAMVFRKRVLRPGAAIGYHQQNEDEIYYVVSGRGLMTIDGKTLQVGPGTAILTRPGSSHGLEQTGSEDLVIIVNYLQQPR